MNVSEETSLRVFARANSLERDSDRSPGHQTGGFGPGSIALHMRCTSSEFAEAKSTRKAVSAQRVFTGLLHPSNAHEVFH